MTLTACGLLLLAGAGIGTGSALGAFSSPSESPAQLQAAAAQARAAAQAAANRRLLTKENRYVARATAAITIPLPRRAGAPAPAVPAQLFRSPLPAHEVFGYVPYWLATGLTPSDLTSTSVLAWYGIAIAPTGALEETGPGWADFIDPGFATFVSSAHAAGDRVLLTVYDQTPASIARMLKSPATTSAELATQLLPFITADKLDGVDIDIEGRSPALRPRFVTFVADLTKALRAADPSGEILLNTYPQSAGSKTDFFNVKALAHFVDQLFVMAYDMYDPTRASANAPLASPTLGLSDVQTLLAYVKQVPTTKIVLGMPFYGYDFTTRSEAPGAAAVTPLPSGRYYSAIAKVGRKAYWDPGSMTPYTRFKLGKRPHETWYDNPVSIALKTALAEKFHLVGVGVWALGMEGSNTSMLVALEGGSPPVKLPVTSP